MKETHDYVDHFNLSDSLFMIYIDDRFDEFVLEMDYWYLTAKEVTTKQNLEMVPCEKNVTIPKKNNNILLDGGISEYKCIKPGQNISIRYSKDNIKNSVIVRIRVCDIDKNGDIVKNLPLKIADYGSNYTKYHGRCINLGNNEAMVIFPNPDDTTTLLKCLIIDTNYTHGGIEILEETSFTKVGLLITGLPVIPLNNGKFLCIYKDPSSTTTDNTKWLSYIFTTPATVKPAETKIRGVTKSKLTTESVSNPNDDENVWVLPTNGPGYERHFASGEITIPTDATKIIIENVSKIPDNIILLKRWSYSVTNDVTLTLGYIKQGDICYYCDENWNKKSSLFSYEITSSYNISEYTSLSFIIDKDNLVIYNNSGFVDGDYIYFIM